LSTGSTGALTTNKQPDIIPIKLFQFFSTGEEIMTDQMPPITEEPKKNNTTMIIAIVVVVVLCCCCAVLAGGWFYGDQILQALGQ
jgi:hypothetical protein